jgi:hypothetical protein
MYGTLKPNSDAARARLYRQRQKDGSLVVRLVDAVTQCTMLDRRLLT